MIHKSITATSHHYYSFLLRSELFNNTNIEEEIVSSFHSFEKIKGLKNSYHLQELINSPYGSIDYLEPNKIKKGNVSYYYHDFYFSIIELNGEKYAYICYPYKSMEEYLYSKLKKVFNNSTFNVPVVNIVLEHTKNNTSFNAIEEGLEVLVDVIKYSAEVIDQDNADKVNLVGSNPQDSEIYKKLNELFSMRPLSVKLRFSKSDNDKNKQLDLIFDRVGNYRFWIPKDKMEASIQTLNTSFKYLNSINSLKEVSELSKHHTIDEN